MLGLSEMLQELLLRDDVKVMCIVLYLFLFVQKTFILSYKKRLLVICLPHPPSYRLIFQTVFM